jgi:hypothetical protein
MTEPTEAEDHNTIRLTINSPSGSTVEIEADPQTTVRDVVEHVTREMGLAPAERDLVRVRDGLMLQPTATLSQLEVHHGETLELFLRMQAAGGGGSAAGRLRIRTRSRSDFSYHILRVELETLRATYDSPYSLFLGMSFGAAVTLTVAPFTADLGTARPYFIAFAVAFWFVSFFLFLIILRDRKRANRLVDEVMKQG